MRGKGRKEAPRKVELSIYTKDNVCVHPSSTERDRFIGGRLALIKQAGGDPHETVLTWKPYPGQELDRHSAGRSSPSPSSSPPSRDGTSEFADQSKSEGTASSPSGAGPSHVGGADVTSGLAARAGASSQPPTSPGQPEGAAAHVLPGFVPQEPTASSSTSTAPAPSPNRDGDGERAGAASHGDNAAAPRSSVETVALAGWSGARVHENHVPTADGAPPDRPAGAADPQRPSLFVSDMYAVHVLLSDIQSIRRQAAALGSTWPHITILLKGGVPLPPLYFHDGGIKDFFTILKQTVPVSRSKEDNSVYLVHDEWTDWLEESPRTGRGRTLPLPVASEADVALQQVEQAMRDMSWAVLERFSQVTKFARDTAAQLISGGAPPGSSSSHAHMPLDRASPAPSAPDEHRAHPDTEEELSDFGEFQIVDATGQQLDGWRLARGPEVSVDEWIEAHDNEGRIADVPALTQRIFRGGVSADIRPVVWKFLLGFYPWDSTLEERERIDRTKKAEYYMLKQQWTSISPQQERRFSKFRERRSRIEKDVIRTDRDIELFAAEDNEYAHMMTDILLTYTFYNFDLGYCQGMSDLLSPIVYVLRSEVEAFWCFCGLMDNHALERNFDKDQAGIHSQLVHLSNIVKLSDRPLWDYLSANNCGNYFFCFRWLVINFKREFVMDQLLRLWEMMWTQEVKRPVVHMCAALLIHHRRPFMERCMQYDDILKYVNDLSGRLSVDRVIGDAEAVYRRLHHVSTHTDPPALVPTPF